MESSHLVIFTTSGKFITKFIVLWCISLRETLFWTGVRGRIPITLRDQNSQHFMEDLAVNASAFSLVLCFKAINYAGPSNYVVSAN